MALRISVVFHFVAPFLLIYLFVYYHIFVRMTTRQRITKDDFDLHLNRPHLDLSVPRSSPEKTEYKTSLRKFNFWVPARSPSVSETSPLYQQADGTTFVPGRKSNLKVNNGGTDMQPESLNHNPVHRGFLANPPSVSETSSPYQQAKGTTFVPGRKLKLKVNNGGTDMQPESLHHGFMANPPSVSATPSPHQQAKGTTFVPGRKLKLKVKNGRSDMPDL
ncbi:hypothetical protein EJD97_002248 [Solanum chilense]|uniref:Uncharacterized protein n=1 Tax=Solanum chilense TaxID=4083 RepID=A0A6N2AP20_SOLCI|nr:hypothetical protein EJD97_002248 [Solanum chilense]